MKNKLQALIAEQKALTAKFEELLSSTTEESPTVDLKKVFIKGHPTRGAEVIKMLEDLGGVNALRSAGVFSEYYYYIDDSNTINHDDKPIALDYTELHLPEEVSEVDPPAEVVELIEGEVYYVPADTRYAEIYIYQNKEKDWLCTYFPELDGLYIEVPNGMRTIEEPLRTSILATPEQRKQLFDALEKAGKHFDKENMRLLDVEEWSCEKGLPFIARHHNKDKWKCVIFWEFYNIKDSNERPIALFKSNEYCDYKCAIPYNDQTKHLVGTTDSPDKHYKFVGNGE